MYDVISIGDTSHNVFLDMKPEDAHLYCEIKPDVCQLCFNYADKIPVRAFHDTIGGNSCNAAVAFARLGFKTALYTHIGGDDQGERIVRGLQTEGISTDYVKKDPELGSNFSTVINLNAERTILVYHEHRHYALPQMEPASWIYFSSMGEGFESIFPSVVEYVQQHGTNLCWQPGTFQLNFGAAKAKSILEQTRIFFVNKEEAELYLGMPHGSKFRDLLDGSLALGAKIAVITDGPKGAYVSDGKEYLYLGIIPADKAPRIEATGAGDSFSSAFASAIAHGETLSEALRWGQCESSSVIQKIGPQAGLLTRKELVDLLVSFPELQPQQLSEVEK